MNFSPVWWGVWLPHSSTAAFPQPYYLVSPVCQSSHEQLATTESELLDPPTDERTSNKRRVWTAEEDQRLINLIREFQNSNGRDRISYRLIAKKFSGRTSKQIRERYLNKLDPRINFAPFCLEEDERICEFYLKEGPHWKELSLLMPGRTTTMIKNRFNTKLRSQLLHRKKRKAICQSGRQLTIQAQ